MSTTKLYTVASILSSDYPEQIKKIMDEFPNLNEVLENLLKMLGNGTNESELVYIILDLIPKICAEGTIQQSEKEFTVLSCQSIYNMNIFKMEVKCKLLEVITSILLMCESSEEITTDVVDFLLGILDSNIKTDSVSICTTSINCLTEIEMSIPGIMVSKIEMFKQMLNQDLLKNKSAEILSLIIRNAGINEVSDQCQILHSVLELLPVLHPFSIAFVTRNILDICCTPDLLTDLSTCLKRLIDRYKPTFDLCILQTIVMIQERLDGISEESAVFLSSTHPALPVGRNLIALDWLASCSNLKISALELSQFEPSYFDGADARLKKLLFLSNVLLQESLDSTSFYHHFDNLLAFAVNNPTSRAFAAVFRVMRHMIEKRFPANGTEIVYKSTVDLGTRHPNCLPHVVDFLKYLGSSRAEQLSETIVLGLIDTFNELETNQMLPHIEHLIQFFLEATLYHYEYCQPRMILRIIRKCLEDKKTSDNNTSGVAVLELCQALIRNQDYEIFQPELKTLLSIIETNHEETDVKQRAWMLRSLITHVNTDSLKDAFDVDINLSSTGKIEHVTYPLISLNIMFDYKIIDNTPANWSLERKRVPRSFYFPLEIRLVENPKSNYREFFGIQIEFSVDSKWGRVESLYIPVLEVNEVKKACLQLLPSLSSAIIVNARSIVSTVDGRIFVSDLEPIHLKLEHFLNPLSSNKSFQELWDRLANQSEKGYTSTVFLPQPENLLQAVKNGELERFQKCKERPTELAMVTPDSFLVLVRILSVKNSWNAEAVVEDPSVLPVVYSLLSQYSTVH